MRSRPWIVLTAVLAALAVLGVTSVVAYGSSTPGSLDTSFGSGGTTLTDIGDPMIGGATGLVRESDGSFAAVGSGASGPEVAHYDSSGALDASFGSGGVAVLPTHNSDILFQPSIAYQPSTGDLIVAGTWEDPATPYTPGDYGLLALKTDGSLDTSFGSSGIVDAQIGDSGTAAAVAVDPTSGGIFVGGDATVAGSDNQLALAAFDSDGAPNTGFGSSGSTLTPLSGGGGNLTALALDGSDIVASGEYDSTTAANALVMRYTSAGAPDTTFDTGTPVALALGDGSSSYSGANSVLVQSTHDIVIGGYATFSGTGCMTLARVTSAGALDSSFGSSGSAHLCAGDDSTAYGIAQSSDGSIYVTGNAFSNSVGLNQVALARFTGDGTLDTGFGNAGEVLTDADGAGNSSQGSAIVLDDTNPVIAGQAYDLSSSTMYYMVERYIGGSGSSATSAPVNSVLPTIDSSTATVGQTLTGTAGTWSGSPTDYLYKWYACPSASSDDYCHDLQAEDESPTQTTNSYTVKAADVAPGESGCSATGCYLKLMVVAANAVGSTPAESSATTVLGTAPPSNSAAPTISSGTAIVGQSLTATAGTWTGSPTYYIFDWELCPGASTPDADCKNASESDIQTSTTDQYTPKPSDAGSYLRVWVRAYNAAGRADADSGTSPVYGPPVTLNGALPSWSGQALVGDQLVGHAGSWSGSGSASGSAAFPYAATYLYTWLRCPANISSVTDCTQAVSTFGASTSAITPPDSVPYALTQQDFGYRMELAVVASNAAGESVTAYAPKTTPYVDDKAGTLHKLAQSATTTAKQGAAQVPSASKLLATTSGGPKITFTLPSPADLIAGGTAWVIAAGGGNVIAAGGGNVIAAGGGNVIAAGGGNVIAAGGGNVIAAGDGNVIAAGGGNVIAAGGGNFLGHEAVPGGQWLVVPTGTAGRHMRTPAARAQRNADLAGTAARASRKGRLVTLFRGEHKFTRSGHAKLVLRLTKAGRKLLRTYEKQVKNARRHHRKVKPVQIGFVTVTRPLHGKRIGTSSVKLIKLRP